MVVFDIDAGFDGDDLDGDEEVDDADDDDDDEDDDEPDDEVPDRKISGLRSSLAERRFVLHKQAPIF